MATVASPDRANMHVTITSSLDRANTHISVSSSLDQANTRTVDVGVSVEVSVTVVRFLVSVPRVPSSATVPQWHQVTSSTVPQWRRVAHLARMAVDENEIVQLCTQLDSILSFASQLSDVNVDGVEPMTSVIPMIMKRRADAVTEGANVDAVLANAPETDGKYFLVPKVIE